MKRLWLGISIIFLIVGPSVATTYTVLPNGSGDFPTIQAAIDAAVHFDIIELGDGVFAGPGNRNISYRGLSITVRSQSGDPSLCIIDCYAAHPEGYRGFEFETGEGRDAVLDGVAIIGAYYDESGDHWGAGILCYETSPTIRNCIIRDCASDIGGGITIVGGSPLIENCTVIENIALGNYSHNDAAGISCWATSAEIVESVIAFNTGGPGLTVGGHMLPAISCTIVYGNENVDWCGEAQSYPGKNANSARDPLFCDLAAGDLRLDADSPCLPENSDCGGLIGATLQGCDLPTFSISGETVDASGPPLQGAFIDAAPYYFASDSTGGYRMEVRPDWEGTVTPWYRGHLFEPRVREFAPIVADQIDQGFIGERSLTRRVPADFTSIQPALDHCLVGDSVLVAPGIYTGAGNLNLNFHGTDLVLLSESGSDSTVIDCERITRGMRFFSGEGPSARVEGFTIRNGYLENYEGGGIAVVNSSPTLVDLILEGNEARGGGIFVRNGSPNIERILFAGNISWEDGAGILCEENASPILTSATFVGNNCLWGGGAIGLDLGSTIEVNNTLIAFNSAAEGGGIYLRDESSTAMIQCSDLYANAGGNYGGHIADQTGMNGNISEHPFFCDFDTGNFQLATGSPCLPPNNSCAVLIGARGEGCDAATPAPSSRPSLISLAQNHPNPFNPRTTIGFSLPTPMKVGLTVHDVTGRRILTLRNRSMLPAGFHEIDWLGQDESERPLTSGVYFYHMDGGDFSETKKMILMK